MPFGMSAIIVIFHTSFGNQRKLRNKIKIRSVESHLNDPNYHHPSMCWNDQDTPANDCNEFATAFVGL